jgi:hypothetical protein
MTYRTVVTACLIDTVKPLHQAPFLQGCGENFFNFYRRAAPGPCEASGELQRLSQPWLNSVGNCLAVYTKAGPSPPYSQHFHSWEFANRNKISSSPRELHRHFHSNCVHSSSKQGAISESIKKWLKVRHRWLPSVILATQEAEIRRIAVQSQPWASNSRDPISKKKITKRGWQSGSSGRVSA